MLGQSESIQIFRYIDMELSHELLAALRCPESTQRLHVADTEELATINEKLISSGEEPVEGALVAEDGRLGYPIDDGYPVLLLARQLRLSST